MHLTKGSEYALRSLAFLASRPHGFSVPLAEIAEAQGLPAAFLAKIFLELTRHGIVAAKRGRGSGYSLARPAASITIREIFEAVEGPRLGERCLLWSGYCHDRRPCPLHEYLKDLAPTLEEMVGSITLAQYAGEAPDMARHVARPLE